MRRQLALLVVTILAATIVLGGCQKIQELIGSRTVENPEEGTPEWVVQQAIIAAMQDETDEGWKIIRPHLHTKLVDSPISERDFRRLNFEAFHRKHKLYLADDTKPVYEIDYTEESEKSGELAIFVVNEKSDMPTPCHLLRDPAQNNAWKIVRCSL